MRGSFIDAEAAGDVPCRTIACAAAELHRDEQRTDDLVFVGMTRVQADPALRLWIMARHGVAGEIPRRKKHHRPLGPVVHLVLPLPGAMPLKHPAACAESSPCCLGVSRRGDRLPVPGCEQESYWTRDHLLFSG